MQGWGTTAAWSVDVDSFLLHLIRKRLCEQKGVSLSWEATERSGGEAICSVYANAFWGEDYSTTQTRRDQCPGAKQGLGR